MKAILRTVVLTMSMIASTTAFAGEQTVTLNVDGMTCVSCPYIVKQTLASVEGVTAVEVSFEEKSAVVTFDDNKTEIAALTSATANVGFTSSLKE